MEISKYQTIIDQTAVYPREVGALYCALGLCGEAGEVAEKIKKLVRDTDYLRTKNIPHDFERVLTKELGDVLWYVTATANEFGISLEEVLKHNYEKLLARRATGTLHGSGDDRELNKNA